MKTQHTPGPWHIGMNPGPIIYGPKGEQIADCSSITMLKEENKANATLIVRAANSHQALVELAQELLRECEIVKKADHLCLNHDTFAEKARAALKLAQESEGK